MKAIPASDAPSPPARLRSRYSTPEQELDTNLLLRFDAPDLVAAKTVQPHA
jgi:hypothetical protein